MEEDIMENATVYPSSYNTLVQAAVSLGGIGEYRDAIRLLRKAVKLDKLSPQAYLLLGLNYESLGDLEKAEVNLRQAVSLSPDENEEKMKTLGLFLISHDKKAEGFELLSQYVCAGNWKNENLLNTIVEIGRELDRLSDTRDVIQTVWENTYDDEVGDIYATLLNELKAYQEAGEVFRVIAKMTGHHDLWNQAGLNFSLAEKKDEAVDAFQKAIEAAENAPDWLFTDDKSDDAVTGKNHLLSVYYSNLAYSYIFQHFPDFALEAAHESLKYNPGDIGNYETLLFIQVSLQKYDEAISLAHEAINNFLSTSENLSKVYKNLLTALENKDRMSEYLEVFQEATSKYPGDIEFYKSAAEYMIRSGKHDVTIEMLKKIVQSNAPESEKGIAAFGLYTFLILAGKDDQAWEVVRPFAENVNWHRPDIKDTEKPYHHTDADIRFKLLLSGWTEKYLIDFFEDPMEIYKKLFDLLLEHFPNDPYLLTARAVIQVNENDTLGAENLLRHALVVDDQSLRLIVLINLSALHLLRNEVSEASKILVLAYAEQTRGWDILSEESSFFSPWVTIRDVDPILFTNFFEIISTQLETYIARAMNQAIIEIISGDKEKASWTALELLLYPSINELDSHTQT